MAINEQVLNRLAVVKAIRRHGPIARSELTGLTGLSGGTISQLTRDLVSRGLVVEKKQDPSGQIGRTGRRRVDLAINARGGVVLGASVGGPTGLTISFVDLAGNNLFSMDRGSKPPRSLEGFALGIAQALQEAIATSPLERDQVSRVGIALPAVVDNERGIVHFMATLGCGSVPFADIISDRLGLPVTIENEMVCMARAEHWFGRARDLEDFTLVEVGYQVGSAEYRHDLPRFGAHGLSSEIGHTKVSIHQGGPECHCGGTGCVTTYSSMFGLIQRMGWAHLAGLRSVTEIEDHFARLLDLFERGDLHVAGLLDDAALHLAAALANHLNGTDPGSVLVLVPNSRYKEFLEKRTMDLIPAMCMPGILQQNRILFHLSDEGWRWKGSAALALEKLYLDEVAFLDR